VPLLGNQQIGFAGSSSNGSEAAMANAINRAITRVETVRKGMFILASLFFGA